MEKHYRLTDTEFEKNFKNCDFDVTMFSHEAHLRLAWIHIDSYGLKTAEENVVEQLKNYTKFVGAEDKFNLTLTLAAVKAVYHFYLKYRGSNFTDFIENSPELKRDFKSLMSSHYSFDIFKSQHAKESFVAPDLQPFD